MADRPRGSGGPEEGTPEYDWLYGSRGSARPADPDDATQVIRNQGEYDDATRRMPAVPNEPTSRPRQSPPPPRGRGGRPPGPPPRRDPRRRPAPRPRRRSRLGWLKLALLAWLVFLIAVPFWAWSKVATVDATPPEDTRPDEQGGTTYLLVGSDSREGLSDEQRRDLGTGNAGGQRTDTIMLLHTGSGPNLLMSIPRDSLVEVPGYGTTKINAAFAYGGPRLLVRTIEQNTGIRVDDYIEVGFGGFVDIVDAVGGIQICPTMKMNDPQANLNVEKGCQEADGKTALAYARSRKLYLERGDVDRGKAQREVISGIGAKIMSPWTFINPVRYYRTNMAGAESLRVSEGTGPIAVGRFAFAMTRVDGKNGLTCTVPIQDLAVNWDPQRSRELFQKIIDDNTDSVGKRLCTPTGLPQ